MSEKMKDKYELALDEQILKIKACQSDKGTFSCFKCDALFDCALRKAYVNAVYNSMSKGKSEGGFDF